MPHKYTEGTVHFLWKCYREDFFHKFNIVAPSWNKKDWSLWCKLVKEIGYENVEKMYNFLFENWVVVKTKFRLNGYPTIPLMWGFRHSFLDFMNEKEQRKTVQPKRPVVEGIPTESLKNAWLNK